MPVQDSGSLDQNVQLISALCSSVARSLADVSPCCGSGKHAWRSRGSRLSKPPFGRGRRLQGSGNNMVRGLAAPGIRSGDPLQGSAPVPLPFLSPGPEVDPEALVPARPPVLMLAPHRYLFGPSGLWDPEHLRNSPPGCSTSP